LQQKNVLENSTIFTETNATMKMFNAMQQLMTGDKVFFDEKFVESSTDFLVALQDTNKSLTTGMTLPRTPSPQMRCFFVSTRFRC
jgi:hypothetical protein